MISIHRIIILQKIKPHIQTISAQVHKGHQHCLATSTLRQSVYRKRPFVLITCIHPCYISTSATNNVGYKLRSNIRDCYSLFNLTQDCTEEELREAYLHLAKQYHPDSGTSTACPRKFSQIQEAYIAIKENVKQQIPETRENEEEEDEFDFPYTLPQHRQYLGNEGIGFGSPSQRQHQYDKYKVRRAADVVYEFRMNKNISGSEDALLIVNKNQREARKKKISNTIDRIVEDLIQESMSKGEFENLSGKGKPLDYNERNPLVDTMTHNINKILINNGYAPEWITLEKEIREDTKRARQRLAVEIARMGNPPLSVKEHTRWKHHLKIFESSIIELNDKIMRFNMNVPASLIQKQRIPYNVDREVKRVRERYLEFLPPEEEMIKKSEAMDNYITSKQNDRTEWTEMWKNIKESFKSLKSDSVKRSF